MTPSHEFLPEIQFCFEKGRKWEREKESGGGGQREKGQRRVNIAVSLTTDAINPTETNSPEFRFIQPRALHDENYTCAGRNINN